MVDERLAGGSGQTKDEIDVDFRYRAAKQGMFPFSYETNQATRLLSNTSIIAQFLFQNECSNLFILLPIADLVEQEDQQLTQIGKSSALSCD